MAAADAVVPAGFTLDQPAGLPPGFKLDPPTPFVPSGEKETPSLTSPEGIAGQPLTRFALGAAAPVLGAAQAYAHYSPPALAMKAAGLPTGAEAIDQHLAQLQQMKEQGRAQTQGSTGIDIPELAGQVFSPAFLKWAQGVPGGATYIQKVLQGMGVGAGAGMTTPVTGGDFDQQKATQVASGAAVGAAIPAAAIPIASGVKAAYHGLVEPWANPAAIKGRTYLGAAGDKVQEIIDRLRAPQQLVPGSMPTAGEAAVPAGSAEFSNLQRQAGQIAPTPYVARADQQNAARLAALRSVGQNETALRGAEAERSIAAGPLYALARKGTAPADTTPVVAKINLILGKNPGNRELVTELTNVRNGLEQAGSDPQKVSSVLDGLKATLAKKENAFITGTLSGIKNDLAKAIPGYEQAQAVFAAKSAPVNQMQVGQYLEKKLVPALSEEGKQKAATFASALVEAPNTIKRATGAPRFDKLEQVLTPEQMKVVEGIHADLARGARLDELAGKGAQAAPDIVTAMGNQKLPNLLNRHVMLANAVISRLEGKVNKKIAAEIAAEMLNPAQTGESMAQALARQNKIKAITTTIQPYLRGAQAGAAIEAVRGGK